MLNQEAPNPEAPQPATPEHGTFTLGQRLEAWTPHELMVAGRESALTPQPPAVLRELPRSLELIAQPRPCPLGQGSRIVYAVVASADALDNPEIFDRLLDLQALWPRWPTTPLAVVIVADATQATALSDRLSVRRLLRRTQLPVLIADERVAVTLPSNDAAAQAGDAGVQATFAPGADLMWETSVPGCRLVVINGDGTVASRTRCDDPLQPLMALLEASQ